MSEGYVDSMSAEENPQALIYGYFGQKNTGDDSILWGLLSEICQRVPDFRLKILSREPCKLPESAQPRTEFLRLSVFDVLKTLRSSQLLIFAGGTHIHDDDSNHSRRIMAASRILGLSVLAKLLGIKIAHISIGFGPIRRSDVRLLANLSIRLADFVSVRDRTSAAELKGVGVNRDIVIGYDASLLMNPSSNQLETEGHDKSIGISVLPFKTIYGPNHEGDEKWLSALCSALKSTLAENPGLRLRVLEFSANDIHGDRQISEDLVAGIGMPEVTSIVPYSEDPCRMIREVANCDFFVGMRYHSSLFAISQHVPCVVLAYAGKCSNLAADFGLTRSVVLQREMENEHLLAAFFRNLVLQPDRYVSYMNREDQIERALHSIPSATLFDRWVRRG